MTFDAFITKWNGRGIDFDGAYGDQCMDLMHQYHVEVLGIPDGRTLAAPGAKDVYLSFDKMFNRNLFEKIPNTPTGVPKKGDIVLWGTDIGPWGHVAIFVEGDANRFQSFDQNFPTGSKCKLVSHSYTGVLGWLRFKALGNNVDTTESTLEILSRISAQFGFNERKSLPELLGHIEDRLRHIKALEETLKDKEQTILLQKALLDKKPTEIIKEIPVEVVKEVTKEVQVERVFNSQLAKLFYELAKTVDTKKGN